MSRKIQAKTKKWLCSWKALSSFRQLWAFPTLATGYFANVIFGVHSPCNSLLSNLRSQRNFVTGQEGVTASWFLAYCFSVKPPALEVCCH